MLEERIKEIAMEIAPDYPDIEKVEPWEQLCAIKSSYDGTDMANKDLHQLIGLLRQELDWSPEQLLAFWDEHKPIEGG